MLNEMLNKGLPEMVLKKGLSDDDFWYQQSWWARCSTCGAGGGPMPGPGDQANSARFPWLACSLPGTLQGNVPPTPTLPLPTLQHTV